MTCQKNSWLTRPSLAAPGWHLRKDCLKSLCRRLAGQGSTYWTEFDAGPSEDQVSK